MTRMIKCKNCGKIYPIQLSNCPECFTKNKNYTAAIFISVFVFVFVFLMIMIGFRLDDNSNVSPNNTPPDITISDVSLSKQNAVKMAKSYLRYSAFSRQGLIEQLEYEQFSNEDAVYGVDNCGANWNEQAAKMAKSYLKFSAFSRQGLIEQLEYEGFTSEQAIYGVDSVGL